MIKSKTLIDQVNEFYVNKSTKIYAINEYFDSLLGKDESYVNLLNAIGSLKYEIAKNEFNGINDNGALKNELKNLELEKFNKIKNTGYFDAINNAVECKICKDKGTVNNKRCKCFNKRLTEISLKYLGVNKKEPCFFKDANAKEIEKQKILLEKYSANFPKVNVKNFVLLGNVGTGKTFLSKCVYTEVLKKGFNALFLTATELNNVFLKMHLGEVDRTVISDVLSNSDLLIIDDLGTEPKYNNVTVEFLLSLISDRLDKNKPFIITTNLSLSEIKAKYNERLVSRLSSEKTAILPFKNKDLRIK
ncbi:MAG: ATP-binding protein [Clostridia bacterium]|nr:ATP-binding protein [Clostridia bacterium]